MSGYTKTTIIDCPRSQSEEAQGFNNKTPNIWTNRVGTGFKLKAGDKISVHSSYISELGAQSGEIQIKGIDLNDDKTVKVIQTKKKLPIANQTHDFALHESETIDVVVPTRDDTLNLVVSPYKTANGENYVHLPRRFATNGESANWTTFDVRGGAVARSVDQGATIFPPQSKNICPADLQTVFDPYGTGGTYASKIAGNNDNQRYTIYRSKKTFFRTPESSTVLVLGDATNGSDIITINSHSSTDTLIPGMVLVGQSPNNVFAGTDTILEITDSTIKMSAVATGPAVSQHNQFSFRFPGANNASFLPALADLGEGITAAQSEALRDPAIFNEYEQVRDLISLPVSAGYNSPEDISAHMTQEINKRGQLKPKTAIFRNTALNVEYNQHVSSISETPSYKFYECAQATYYEKSQYDEWFKTDAGRVNGMAYSYLSSYQHIGIKRPEIYNAGKKLNDGDGVTTEAQDYQTLGDQVLMTPFAWSQANIDLFREFIDAQANYPDLFEGYTQSGIEVNSDSSRYIHMNLYDDGPLNPDGHSYPSSGMIVRSGSAVPSFGYDLYSNTVSASMTSFPLFFDFNPATVDLKATAPVSYANYGGQFGSSSSINNTDYNELVGGFARKVLRKPAVAGGTEQYYIGLQFTRVGNKIPDHFFNLNAESDEYELGVAGGRTMGFDRHFTGYGNAAILPYNGNMNKLGRNRDATVQKYATFAQHDAERQVALDPWQTGIYIGAEAPAIGYDTDQSRFSLSYFHTPEVVGNTFDAGRDDGKVDSPNNPDSDVECYKVNKRFLATNFTPEVAPYYQKFSASFASASDITYSAQNPSVSLYTIFDAHSGLFIEDWVVGEKKWNEALVGIMGFRYDQFHNPNSKSSRQVRIKDFGSNGDLNNVNIITTNADVNQGDLIDWGKNLYGFNDQNITNPVGLEGIFTNTTKRAFYMTPPVTQKNPGSIKITAQRLPTKTLRPYYTIRSDIVLDNNYLGSRTSGVSLPVVAITNKANPYGDFLNGVGGEIVFTNTIDRVLTSIKCSINEPDGSAARVDLNSSVIFKIDQQVNADMNLVDTLLQSKKKSDNQAGMEAEDPLGGVDMKKIKYNFE